jgi:hypothetical protein
MHGLLILFRDSPLYNRLNPMLQYCWVSNLLRKCIRIVDWVKDLPKGAYYGEIHGLSEDLGNDYG